MGYFAEAKIGNICIEIKDKGDFGVIPYLEIGNINIKTKDYSFEEKASVKGCKIAQKGDTLVSRVRPTRGAIAVVKEEKLFVSNAFTVLRPIKPISSRIVWYYLAWNQEFLSYLGNNCTGSLYPTVSDKVIVDYSIPLPPLNEQKRMVARLDKIMPRIDAVKERLDKVPAIVKRFKQSVLTAAVTGKLTEKWRAEYLDIESTEDVNALTDAGITTYWKNVQIECLVKSLKNDLRTGPFGTSLKKSEHRKAGVPVWGIESIGDNGKFTNYNKIFVSEEKAIELKSFVVEGGDIIISRSGTVGELCILPDNIPFGLLSTNLLKISLNKKIIMPRFFCFLFIASPELLDKMRELCSGSTRLFLTQKILKNLYFPLPPLEEQKEIVRQVDKLFTLADRLESHYQKAKARVDKLSQSILAKAFRGELVITEAELAEKEGRDFESAEKLLERILEEKAKMVGSRQGAVGSKQYFFPTADCLLHTAN